MKPTTPAQREATISDVRSLLDGDPLDAVSLYRGHLAMVLGALDEARRERGELHVALRDVLAALGNGSGATPGASVEFMASTPREVAAVVGELRRERDGARGHARAAERDAVEAEARCAALTAERDEARAALVRTQEYAMRGDAKLAEQAHEVARLRTMVRALGGQP